MKAKGGDNAMPPLFSQLEIEGRRGRSGCNVVACYYHIHLFRMS